MGCVEIKKDGSKFSPSLQRGYINLNQDINTEVALLKKEVSDIKVIFSRLDVAIEKITDVSSCVNRMLAVHEEKIANQEEAQSRANTEFTNDIKELHSRVTSNYKELTDMITQHHKEQDLTDATNQK